MRQAVVGVVLFLFVFVTLGWTMEGPTVELGRQLFESNSLGYSEKSCSSCHAEGKGLSKLSAYEDADLKEMVNYCIEKALNGKPFALESQELDSLLLYLRSLPQTP